MTSSLAAILILQWCAILALAVILLACVRQLGVLHQRLAPAGALMTSQGIKVGARAPELKLKALDGTEVAIAGAGPGNRSTLIMFVSPDCPVCASLLPALISIGKQETDWLRIVFASDGAAADHSAFWRDKGLDAFPYVVSTELGLTFHVAKLPHGVLLDEQGVLVSQGLTNSREHVESLFEAKRLKVASIQEYLARSGRHPTTASPNGSTDIWNAHDTRKLV
jgi:methylamine dehydrogenase accessory protein MauD